MKKSFALLAGAIIATLLWMQPAFAGSPPTAISSEVQFAGFSVAPEGVRIVNVYRSKRPSQYAWAPARLGDMEGDWAPVAFRDVIRVAVEIKDPAPSRLDAHEGDTIVTLTIDPQRLTATQTAALSRRRVSERVAVFTLNTSLVRTNVRRIDYARSRLCDADQMRCEEQIVYEDVTVEATEISLDA